MSPLGSEWNRRSRSKSTGPTLTTLAHVNAASNHKYSKCNHCHLILAITRQYATHTSELNFPLSCDAVTRRISNTRVPRGVLYRCHHRTLLTRNPLGYVNGRLQHRRGILTGRLPHDETPTNGLFHLESTFGIDGPSPDKGDACMPVTLIARARGSEQPNVKVL